MKLIPEEEEHWPAVITSLYKMVSQQPLQLFSILCCCVLRTQMYPQPGCHQPWVDWTVLTLTQSV